MATVGLQKVYERGTSLKTVLYLVPSVQLHDQISVGDTGIPDPASIDFSQVYVAVAISPSAGITVTPTLEASGIVITFNADLSGGLPDALYVMCVGSAAALP